MLANGNHGAVRGHAGRLAERVRATTPGPAPSCSPGRQCRRTCPAARRLGDGSGSTTASRLSSTWRPDKSDHHRRLRRPATKWPSSAPGTLELAGVIARGTDRNNQILEGTLLLNNEPGVQVQSRPLVRRQRRRRCARRHACGWAAATRCATTARGGLCLRPVRPERQQRTSSAELRVAASARQRLRRRQRRRRQLGSGRHVDRPTPTRPSTPLGTSNPTGATIERRHAGAANLRHDRRGRHAHAGKSTTAPPATT